MKKPNHRSAKPLGKKDVELSDLREKVKDRTESILKLVKSRENLVNQIALLKSSKNIPIENKSVETSLLDSVQKFATSIDLDPRMAMQLTRGLIESSKSSQRRAIYLPQVRRFMDSNSIVRVGIVGAGRMGSWFASYFLLFGRHVSLYDSDKDVAKRKSNELKCDYSDSLETIASNADLIVVSVPTSEASQIISDLQNKTKGEIHATVIEISSIKGPVLSKTKKGNVSLVSLHPLFGSSAGHFDSNRMIQVQGSKKLARALFPHFEISYSNPKEHDRLMALELSLPHLLALLFASILLGSPRRRARIARDNLASPSYDSFLALARKTLAENPRVYYEIQRMNEYNVFEQIERSLENVKSIILSSPRNYKEFERLFLKARKELG